MGHVRLKLSFVFVLLNVLSCLPMIIVASSSWDYLTPPEVLPNDLEFEKDFDWQFLNMLKDEVQEMRKDLTASFIDEHSRKKRSLEDYTNEARLGSLEEIFGQGVNYTFKTDDVGFTTTVFQDELYIFQKEGIYKIKGLNVAKAYSDTDIKINTPDTNVSNYSDPTQAFHIIEKVFISRWGLVEDTHVVATIEKGDVLFILVEEAHDGYSFLFTYAPKGPGLVLRQRIRNSGKVSAAKFFVFYDQLYLIVASDNEVHSLTSCPIFKWVGTYLDVIHTIQTRGASSVETVVIEGHQYIAIAQSIDAAGNTEIGTQIVRMNRQGELEKVQLLYSNQPVHLHFTKVYHEYILIVAQKQKSAIIYFYGGYDFIHLQSLPTLKGSHVRITSVLGPDSETYILAASGSDITIFVRAATNSPLTALMFAPYENNTYSVSTTNQNSTITGITVKTPQYNTEHTTDAIFLAITWGSDESSDRKKENFVELYTLVFEKIPKVSSSYKQPEDKLSKCLLNLQYVLETSEPHVQQLQLSNATILRKSADMRYRGTLNSQTLINVETKPETTVEHLIIKPHLNYEDESKLSPSQLQSRVLENIRNLENTISPKLKNVLIRDEINTLSGELHFVNGVKVQEMNAPSVEFTNLNGIPWNELRTNALRTNTTRLQTVTGNWSVEEISAEEVQTAPIIGGININEILLTYTEPNQPQVVHTPFNFNKTVEFQNGIQIPPTQKINDIEIRDIINTTNSNGYNTSSLREVTGVKTANAVKIENGARIHLVNKVDLTQWYDSVLKTSGPPQTVHGTFVFNGGFNGQSVKTELLNGKNWDTFLEYALVDGKDQFFNREPHFHNLHVDSLFVEEINRIKIRDLLNKHDNQSVSTQIELDELIIVGNVRNERLNGIENITRDNVVHKNENAHIYIPTDFHNLTVNYIELGKGALVSGVDVLKLAETGKTVIYTRKSDADYSQNPPHKINGKIYATDADVPKVNGILISDHLNNAMKVAGGNLLNVPLSFHNIPITVENDFTADSINQEAFENYVKIDGSEFYNGSSSAETITINIPIHFDNAMVHGKIQFAPGVTLNNIDISEYAENIVHKNDTGIVHGVKTFTQEILAYDGIEVNRINHYSLKHDVIMLRNGKDAYDIPHINFTEVEAAFVVSHGPITGGKSQGGLNLTEVEATTVYFNKPATIRSSVEFLSSIETEELIVGGNLNNYSVADILERHILLDSGNITQYVHLNSVVEENLDLIAPVNIESINGVNPGQYFSVLVNRSQDAFIHDRKIFKNQVSIEKNLYCKNGTINDIHLQQLEAQAISKTKNQTITGNMIFHRVDAEHIITSSLCGILVTDFVHIDKDNTQPEVVQSSVHFTTKEATEIGGDIHVAGNINGYSITEIAENLTRLKGDRKFHEFVCHGNLLWNHPRTDTKGFSYVFEETVGKQGDQVIGGHVTFTKGLQAKHIKSYPWLNGVDLQKIEVDGVFGGKDVNFTGKNVIPQLHIGPTGSLEPLQHLSTNFVNRINLRKLNEAVVRRNRSELIHGTKIFAQGIYAESLISVNINGCAIENIARVNDDRVIDSVSFESMEGITDLKFTNLTGFQWEEFLDSRVTLDSPQEIKGQWTIAGNVQVDNFGANQINDLQLDHAVYRNSVSPQEIHGVKTLGGVILNGDIRAHSINGYKIDEMLSRILHKNKPVKINQTIYFEGPVLIKNSMNIEGSVNEKYDMDTLQQEFDSELQDLIKKSKSVMGEHNKSKELLQYLDDELGKAAVWFDYLDVGEYFRTDLGNKDRVEVATLGDEVRIGFSKLASVTGNQCGLPQGCLFNTVDFVEFGRVNYEQYDQIKCKNIFDLKSEFSGRGYTLISHAVSYNQTCSVATDGPTDVFEMTIGYNNGTRITLDKNIVGSFVSGFITDAKTFHSDGIDYLVIAQFYDQNKGNHDTEIFVYAVQNTTLVLVQSLPAIGTLKITVELMFESWFLGVANSLSSVPTSKSHEVSGFDYSDHNSRGEVYDAGALSEIYMWISSQTDGKFGQFRLLREVVTQRVIDVEFVQVQYLNAYKTRVTKEGFAIFAHSDSTIEIYKWDARYMNFVFVQTLALGDEYRVSSVHGLAIKDVTYLIVGSVPQGLLIFEYRCIEGFKLYLEVPLAEVQDVDSFSFNQKMFLPIASSSLTFLAEAKIQGLAFSQVLG